MFQSIPYLTSFILSVTPARADEPNPWSLLAQRDLQAIHDQLVANHPGVVDDENPAFRNWLEAGLRDVSSKVARVTSFEGLVFLTRQYVNGFHDEHIQYELKLVPRVIRWPGFVIALRKGSYVVHWSSADSKTFDKLPSVGAKLVSCDGHSPEEMLRQNLFPFYGNEKLTSDWVALTSRLMVDESNPLASLPTRCEFEQGGQRTTIDLHWVPVRIEGINDRIERAGFGAIPLVDGREVSGGILWVSLPTFTLSGSQVEKMKAVVDKLKAASSAKAVVLDLRGNSGASSEVGQRVVEGLFGQDFVKSVALPALPVDWRVSPENAQRAHAILDYIGANYGRDSEVYGRYIDIDHGIAESQAQHKPFFREEPPKPAKTKAGTKPLYQGKVFLLTDGRCFSGCLDFTDLVLTLPNVVHVGMPTSGDTSYVEPRTTTVPSGIAFFNSPVKVYRGRKRGNNEFYTPQQRWEGDIWDTPKLESWIKELVQGSK
jgi:hypothetical protein